MQREGPVGELGEEEPFSGEGFAATRPSRALSEVTRATVNEDHRVWEQSSLAGNARHRVVGRVTIHEFVPQIRHRFSTVMKLFKVVTGQLQAHCCHSIAFAMLPQSCYVNVVSGTPLSL